MPIPIPRFLVLVCALVGASALACSDPDENSSSDLGMGGRPSSGGSSSVGGKEPEDTMIRSFGPDHPSLVYSGRIWFEAGELPRFSAPGVSISARFKGVSVAALLNDYASSSNYFDAVIDDDYANALKIRPNPEGGATAIVEGLAYGEHRITLVKRTEANTGQVGFGGFIFGGDILPPPERPARKIEIIGDSISCGSGNEALNGSNQCAMDYGRPYSNANKAFGPMLARALEAEYHVTAVSGIGALRNYDCDDTNTMPVVYDRVFLEAADSPAWDPEHAMFVPDAILVALGTNDFSPAACKRAPLNESSDPANYEAFSSELSGFVRRLREYYPASEIFLMSSPMLNDGWPDATYTSDTDHRAALTAVANALNEDETAVGTGKVHLLLADFGQTKLAGRGCGSHPNVFEHGIMAGVDSTKPMDTAPAELFLNPIKQVMRW